MRLLLLCPASAPLRQDVLQMTTRFECVSKRLSHTLHELFLVELVGDGRYLLISLLGWLPLRFFQTQLRLYGRRFQFIGPLIVAHLC